MKIKIKKNDQVLVLAGDDKGKQGRVLAVYRETGRLLVEGVKMVKRHQRPTPRSPQGGIIEKEAPIHVSNVRKI